MPKTYRKPPMGVMPAWVWERQSFGMPAWARDEYRSGELFAAVFRYRAAGLMPSPKWGEELAEILYRQIEEGN